VESALSVLRRGASTIKEVSRSEEEEIEARAASYLGEIARGAEIPGSSFRQDFTKHEDPAASARAMFALERRWVGELGSLVGELEAGLELHDVEAPPDLKKLIREANIRMVECKDSGESVAEGVVDALEQAFPLRMRRARRPELLKLRGVFRFLPYILNGKLDALREGAFMARLGAAEADFEQHEAKLAEEEEASRKRLAALDQTLAEEEEARRKKLEEEEEERDKPFKTLSHAPDGSILPLSVPLLDALFEELVRKGVARTDQDMSPDAIISLCKSSALDDAVRSTDLMRQFPELRAWTSQPLRLYYPEHLISGPGSATPHQSALSRVVFINFLADLLVIGAHPLGIRSDKCMYVFLGSRGTGKTTIMRSLALGAAVLSRGEPRERRDVELPIGVVPRVRAVSITQPFEYPQVPEGFENYSMIGLSLRLAHERLGVVPPLTSLAKNADRHTELMRCTNVANYPHGTVLLMVDEVNDLYLAQPRQTHAFLYGHQNSGMGVYILSGSSHRLGDMLFRPTQLARDETFEHRDKFKAIDLSLNSSKVSMVRPLLPFHSWLEVVDYLDFLGEGDIRPELLAAYRAFKARPEETEVKEALLAEVIRHGATHRGVTNGAHIQLKEIDESAVSAESKAAERASVSMSVRDLFQRVQGLSRGTLLVLTRLGHYSLRSRGQSLESMTRHPLEAEEESIKSVAKAVVGGALPLAMAPVPLSVLGIGGTLENSVLRSLHALADDGQLVVNGVVYEKGGERVAANTWTMLTLCEILAQSLYLRPEEIDALVRPRRENSDVGEALVAESMLNCGLGSFLRECHRLDGEGTYQTFPQDSPKKLEVSYEKLETVKTWVKRAGPSQSGPGGEQFYLSPDARIPTAGAFFQASLDIGGDDMFGVFPDAVDKSRVHLVLVQVKLGGGKGQRLQLSNTLAAGAMERFKAGRDAERAEGSQSWAGVCAASKEGAERVSEVVIWHVLATNKEVTTKGKEALQQAIQKQNKELGVDPVSEGVRVERRWVLADHDVMAKLWSLRIRSWASNARQE